MNARTFFENLQIDYSQSHKVELEPMDDPLVAFLRNRGIFNPERLRSKNLSEYLMPAIKYRLPDPEID
ncbi:MAG: hypothetical protein P8M30_14730 [Planctomycetaceae bacterium]|nr:hypothetical protein [bacterium]MDG2390562.1 hypothetical protein [Planctomycetaceae bacterium]